MRRGITLIEIVVVMAILMILAALLYPVFARAKESGKQGNCLAQLGQVATSMQLYRDDHDDLGYRRLNEDNTYPWNWFIDLEPYLKDGRLLWCVEPGNWGESLTDYSFYHWPNFRTGDNSPLYFRSWDAPAGRVVIVCHNHARGERTGSVAPREGKYLFAREDTSAGKVDTMKLVPWVCYKDTLEWERDPKDTHNRSTAGWLQFPNEPGPPRLEE